MAFALALAGGPAAAQDLAPSADELWDAAVDTAVDYRPVFSEPTWVVPSLGLPRLPILSSNNNLAIALHGGRLFLAWRTAPSHFASSRARLHVVSSRDLGRTWAVETEVALGRDVREPFLLEVGGRLFLYYVELGADPLAFEPRGLWRRERRPDGSWSAARRWGGPQEVAWDFKVRRGRAWLTSYSGAHYGLGAAALRARFRSSADGAHWPDVGGVDSSVYRGGVTEISFEFDRSGRLWAVARNEDGDSSGFGSHVATAPPDRPEAWEFPSRSNPERYDSPRLFRHGTALYLLARRDIGPPIGLRWAGLPWTMRKLLLWPAYSLRPKRTSLYLLDTVSRRVRPLVDLPSAGDTAFPSVARLGPHDFLVANYSSPFANADQSWLSGQVHGTGIYFVRLRFVPVAAPASVRADPAVPRRTG